MSLIAMPPSLAPPNISYMYEGLITLALTPPIPSKESNRGTPPGPSPSRCKGREGEGTEVRTTGCPVNGT